VSKQSKPGMTRRADANGNIRTKKAMSHGSYRCKRKPNSKWCRNGTAK